MKARLQLADLPAKYQQQAYPQMKASELAAMEKRRDDLAVPVKPTIKQRRGGPSKLEAAFAAEFPRYRMQAITLTIANGVKYTPDAFCANRADFRTHCTCGVCVEVKGPHRFDGSIEKLKMAARAWPEFEFWLVTRPGTAWNWERVLP
jgi:hypothetical protein